jgi:hypothetical protein
VSRHGRRISIVQRLGLSAGLLASGLMPGVQATAQSAPPKVQMAEGPAWSALSPAQQSALAPLKRDWPGLDAARKQKWLEIAARFPSMPADERQRVQERMTEWSRMTPEERGRARLQFQEARQISPEQRQSRWDAYLALPEAERRALAKSAGTVPKAAAPTLAPALKPGQPAPNALVARPGAALPELKPVAPTLVQAKPGASTKLITETAKPPPHVAAGAPKIATDPGLVNRSTLLPQSGPQSQATVRPPSAASAAR